MTDSPTTPMQQLWQQQPGEGMRMSIDEVRRRAGRFEKRIFWRNTREYIAAGIGTIVLSYFFVHAHHSLARWSVGLLIAGLAYAMGHLYLKGSTRAPSADAGARCADFFLTELERQRDLISNLWWYLGPLVPGLLLGAIAAAIAHPQPKALLGQSIGHAFVIVVFGVVIWANRRAARCLQRQIDELRGAQGSEG